MESPSGQTPLAVYTRLIGQRSETFVRRHAHDILPGRTAMIAERMASPATWQPPGPALLLYEGLSRPQRFLRKRLALASDRRRVQEFLKNQGVEALMVEFLDGMLPFMDAAKSTGVRWYTFGHGFDVSCRLADPKWAKRFLAHRNADGVFVRAEVIRERLIDKLGLDPSKVHVVRGGIDVPGAFLTRDKKLEVKLVCVGRMMPKKGPLETLKAFRLALKQAPMMRLEMIGDGPLLEAAKRYVSYRDMEDKVNLPGARPPEEVQAALKAADIYVQHSVRDSETGDEEGLPASITEAMALGLPVVSTRHAGIPEAIVEGENGFLVEEGDVEAMAARIVELAMNFDLRLQQGEAGWKRAKDMFTWAGERQRLLELMGLNSYQDSEGELAEG